MKAFARKTSAPHQTSDVDADEEWMDRAPKISRTDIATLKEKFSQDMVDDKVSRPSDAHFSRQRM